MSEIYRDSTTKAVTLEITGATVTAVEFERDGLVISTGATSPAPIPYKITQMDGPFRVNWTYVVASEVYTRSDDHIVVTPLFDKATLVADDPDMASLTDDQVVRLEGIVRGIIETYTGQKFGYRSGLITVWGSGDTILASPERIISLDTNWAGFRPVNGGFGIEKIGTYSSDINIKIPAEEERLFNGFRYNSSGFVNNVGYVISGEFGWRSVPDDVRRAALLLAEEFSCDESVWRDRYIKSVRAADWRFDFHDGAGQGTGSLAADQLLSKYVVSTVAVI